MKNYNKILEAVNKGIQLALDDFEDEDIQNIKSKQVQNRDYTKEYLDFMKDIIDLGLPSGTCWFKYNFGVDYKKLDSNPKDSIPEDWYGNYYAWGELEPKPTYTRDNYKFYHCIYANTYKLTKYNEQRFAYTKADNLSQLQPEDDVAYMKFNNPANIKFHIPSKEQFKELKEYTTKKLQQDYNGVSGLYGLLYTSKINGNSIFLPGAGNYDGSSHEEKKLVTLWTSTLPDSQYDATYFYGNSSTSFSSNTRFCGYPIRPVVILKN